MPSCVRKPWHLKKLCGVGLNDPVPVKVIVSTLQHKIKHQINIVGDCDYYSNANYLRAITLKLCNGHFTLKRPKMTKSFIGKSSMRVFDRGQGNKLITLYWHHHDGGIYSFFCDSEQSILKQLRRDDLLNFYRNKDSTNNMCHMLDFSQKPFDHTNVEADELKQMYHQHVADCEWLTSKVGVDMQYHPSPAAAALYMFDKLRKVESPAPIDYNEARWLLYGSHGGIRFCEPCLIEQAYECDFIGFYSWMLCSSTTFPVKPGTEQVLPADHFHTKDARLEYGLYRAEVGADDTKRNRLFNYRKNNIYTHYDLQVAKEIGLSIRLIMDNQPNALIYPKDTRARMSLAFGDFVMKLFTVRQSNNDCPKLLKLVLNSLWGALCEKNTVRTIAGTISRGIKVEEGISHLLGQNGLTPHNTEPSIKGEYDSHELLDIQPTKNNKHSLTLRNFSKPFKHDWARLGPFITGMGRKRMFDTFKKHEQHIRWIHTDGVVVDKPIDLTDSDQMPLRLARHLSCKSGKISITNCNTKTWIV